MGFNEFKNKVLAKAAEYQMNKKGMMQHPVIAVVIGLFAVVIVGGISVLVLDAFNSSTTNATAQGVFGNGISLFSNFFSQLGTVGTIGGVLLLLVLIGAAGLYAYRTYRN